MKPLGLAAGARGSTPRALYRLTRESKQIMKGCSDEMCSTSAMLTGVRVSDWIDED